MDTPCSSRSNVWQCFDSEVTTEKDGNGFSIRKKTGKCKLCSATFDIKRGNTSNLWAHLERNHITKYTQIAPQKLQQTRLSAKVTPKSSQPSILAAFQKSVPYEKNSKEQKERTRAVLDFITSTGLPLSTLEKPKFIKMLKVFDPRYVAPSRRSATEDSIPKMYLEKKSEIEKSIQANKSSVIPMFSFTTDLWSSAILDPYISLTIHYITAEMELKKHVLETKYIPDKHTGVNLAQAIEELLGYWDLTTDHMACITTDSASNMIRMADVGEMNRLPCFGHLLHNAVSKSIGSSVIAETTKKLKRVVAYFHQSQGRRKKLEADQIKSGKGVAMLHGPCPTRWGSTYLMYQGIEKYLTEIKRVVVADDSSLVPSPDEDRVIAIVVEAFSELSEMTDQLSGDKSVTVSGVLPMVRLIKTLKYAKLKYNEGLEYRSTVYEYIEEK